MSIRKVLAVALLIVVPFTAVLAQTEPGVYARINTSKGEMLFRLDTKNTPATAANFIGLAEGFLYNEARNGVPFFDGLLFFRSIRQYAVFSGDPLNNGNGGPGYTLYRESNADLSAANKGTLMMNGFPRASHGSQFFIMNGSDPFLDTRFTAFGMIISGLEVLDKIGNDDTIESVTIIRVGEEAEGFAVNEESVLTILSETENNLMETIKATEPNLVKQVLELGPDRERTLTGTWYVILKQGNGPKVRSGQTAKVHYMGMLTDGTVFDSSYKRGQPLELAVGIQPMIPGWMEALMDMNSGEKRRIIIPPEMAYGQEGYGPIGPGSWLVFDIELMEIR
jgi:FKBP-type peptidyl-prolyl cis-trans isomerase